MHIKIPTMTKLGGNIYIAPFLCKVCVVLHYSIYHNMARNFWGCLCLWKVREGPQN